MVDSSAETKKEEADNNQKNSPGCTQQNSLISGSANMSDTLLLNEINTKINQLYEGNESLKNRSLSLLGLSFGLIGLVTTIGFPFLGEQVNLSNNQEITIIGVILFYFFALLSIFDSFTLLLPNIKDVGASPFELYKKDNTEDSVAQSLLAEKIKQYYVNKPNQFEMAYTFQIQIINLTFSISMLFLIGIYFLPHLWDYISYFLGFLIISYIIARIIFKIYFKRYQKILESEKIQVLEFFKDNKRLEDMYRQSKIVCWRIKHGRDPKEREKTA